MAGEGEGEESARNLNLMKGRGGGEMGSGNLVESEVGGGWGDDITSGKKILCRCPVCSLHHYNNEDKILQMCN